MISESNQTLCELNGELVTDRSFQGEILLEGQVATFPKVHVTSESLRRSAVTCETAQSAFLEHNETFWQRLQSAWYGHGLFGVLTEMCSDEHHQNVPNALRSSCQFLLVSLRWVNGMQFTFFPHLKLSNDQLLQSFSSNSNWLESPIRHLEWHSKANKFAIALKDDTIRVHYCDNETVPVLKHKLQRNITDLKWKPLSASILAVGTQTAILIWNIDPMSMSTRPSTGAVQVLSYSGHSPVTSLSWSPHGFDQLFACSALSSAIVVWDVCQKKHQVIQHVTTSGGVSRLLFSLGGSKVLAATPSSSFRVFETASWSNERWSQLSGRVQAACWNPNGTILLFSVVGDPRVYSLGFGDSHQSDKPVVDGSKNAVVVLDLTPDDEQDSDVKRDYIHSMVWDETGERLAIMFHPDDPRSHVIALYSVSSLPVFTLTFRGNISGDGESAPNFIAFKPNFNQGSCLTVCYSNGHVAYVPMYFKRSDRKTIAKQQLVASPLDRLSFAHSRSMLNSSQSLWSSPHDVSSAVTS
uniref:Aladin-like n=1 Tax=Phallusia mammillata TaxID=59560 RepID=A0A6F9D5L0_9ASCI|nr:aladin-like [Phallusia mammillata]